MSDRRELDPTPTPPWRETSSADHRAWVIERTRMAVDAAKDKRKRPIEETQ